MITFNGVDLSPYIHKTMSVEGRGLISRDIQSEPVPQKAGSFFRRAEVNERILINEIAIKADTLTELKRKIETLNGILLTDNEVPIQYSDEPERTYYGVSGSIDEEVENENVGIHKTTVEFYCSDPHKFGDEKQTISLRKFTWGQYSNQTWKDVIDG